jgi:hypothetical protein
VAFTWPLARHPATLSLGNEDVYGNAWALAWVARQALRDPARLLEANVYHPHPRSLTFTEPLLPQAVQAAPVLLLGGSGLLAHNLVALLSFPLAGLGAWLLARELGASALPAAVAGLVYAFVPYRFQHLVHVQALSCQWLPFALLFLRRGLREGRWPPALAAGTFALLQALSSGYYAVMLAVALGVGFLWHWRGATGEARARVAAALAVAGALSLLVSVPYQVGEARLALTRSRDHAEFGSAPWSSWVDPGRFARLPYARALHEATATREALFVSLPALALAAVGAATARRSEPARFAAVLTVVGVALALGPDVEIGRHTVPGPFDLLRALPGVRLLRVPSRLGVLGVLGLALLAALGAARVARGGQKGARAAVAAASVLVAAELWPRGIPWRPADLPPPSARWLAQAPPGVVLELPWDHEHESRGGLYAYWSTVHGQRMVNGWGAHRPADCFGLGQLGRRWPSPYTARVMRTFGVRYVVVHTADVHEGHRRRLHESVGTLPEGVRLLARLGPDWIYELGPRP